MANTLSRPGTSPSFESADAVFAEAVALPGALRAWIVIPVGIALGFLLAVLWSPQVADETIGQNVASTILGSNATTVPLSSSLVGLAFAIAAGLGTTFTACNVCVFSCVAPLARENGTTRTSVGRLLLWMALGVVAVTAVYGTVGAILGSHVPSLSTALVHLPGRHVYPVRLLQSTAVFVIAGIVLLIWGLIALRLLDNPFRRLTAQHQWLVPLFLGVIVGFFTVGRPFPLFHKLFEYAAGTGNPVLAAALTALQGLGNIALMAAIFVLLTRGTGGRFVRWLTRTPLRATRITAISLMAGGTFLVAYWGLRVPAFFGIGWFPHL